MELREYDRAFHRMAREVNALRADIKLVKAITYSPVVQTSGGNGGRNEAMIDKIVDMEAEAMEKGIEFYQRRKEVVEEINGLHCIGIYKDILYMRYVEGKGLRSVAYELGYTYQYVRRSHGQALRLFAEQYGYEERSNKKQQRSNTRLDNSVI